MLRLRRRIEPVTRYTAVDRVACLEVNAGEYEVRPGVHQANAPGRLSYETVFAKEAKIC